MLLKEISISHFRNLVSVQLFLPEQGYCVISGSNGSGKTSILEAIYALSCGKSFRTSDAEQLIQNSQDHFTLFATLQGEVTCLGGGRINIGAQRNRDGKVQARCMSESAKFSDIARLLPARVISPIESYTLINGGPEQRRRFLDWGMFHVKHSYWGELQKLHRILKQKNAALKMRCSEAELLQWNRMLAEVSYLIDAMRQEYMKQLKQIFVKYQEKLLSIQRVVLTYYSGWENSSIDILTQLTAISKQERQLGHCLLGPHRAEIRLETSHGLCKDQLSRGRQKTLAIALYLAQGELLFAEKGKHPLYMIDDFSSELDTEAQELLLNSLNPQEKQIIITLLDQKSDSFDNLLLKQPDCLKYTLLEGVISPVAM